MFAYKPAFIHLRKMAQQPTHPVLRTPPLFKKKRGGTANTKADIRFIEQAYYTEIR
jgi:hypothetical protein